METISFKINKKIEFIFEEGESGISLIQDVQPTFMLVTIPMTGNKRHLLPYREEVEGIYYQEDQVFLFTVQVVERVIDNIPLYKITLPTVFERIQRRDFVRIPISIPLIYMKNSQELEEKVKNQKLEVLESACKNQWQKGYTMDLSGGGMKINIKRPIKAGDQIFIILKHTSLHVGMKGKVVRCTPFIFKNQVSYHLGIKLIDISEQSRETIITFIFAKMRELRKKGR